jgi:hypothetical protein
VQRHPNTAPSSIGLRFKGDNVVPVAGEQRALKRIRKPAVRGSWLVADLEEAEPEGR